MQQQQHLPPRMRRRNNSPADRAGRLLAADRHFAWFVAKIFSAQSDWADEHRVSRSVLLAWEQETREGVAPSEAYDTAAPAELRRHARLSIAIAMLIYHDNNLRQFPEVKRFLAGEISPEKIAAHLR